MRGGTRVALAVGVGYMLGRRRKLGRAAIVAGAAATGGIGSLGGVAMKRGMKALGSGDTISKLAPDIGDIGDRIKGELVSAAKTAAMAAVTNRVGHLTDLISDRAEALRDPSVPVSAVGDVLTGRKAKPGSRRDQDDDGDMDSEEEEPADEAYEEPVDEADEEPADTEDAYEDEADQDDVEDAYEDEPAQDEAYDDEDTYDDEAADVDDSEDDEPPADDEVPNSGSQRGRRRSPVAARTKG